ncbi:PREDICTED: myelin and lymphocyte protein isoform X1 [Mesitornis unicolor]|uniref:myelin and lymphocyte protein isoform X1 n=1 Tax=Mesitornis unicolor TaxID=54374 RepID=UPI000528532B|nr:PREDICTED: myelin and lymphocyte protein isoform X1 [Mesitornis unicolor]
MSSATSSSSLPSGLAVLTTFPDVLFIPEFVFGGLVWILVASSRVPEAMLQGWVMFVSVFCFVMSTSLLCLYICGVHGGSSSWVTLDAICQGTAALFYLSAAVLEAVYTYGIGLIVSPLIMTIYQENIAAVVFAFLATLMYVIHEVFSLLRWKSS